MTPTLSTIIVNWNTADDLKQCLESHFRACKKVAGEVETLIVDNGSTDHSRAVIESFQKKEKNMEFIGNSSNLGFVHACNQGLKTARGENLLLLNPDTILFADTYQKTLSEMPQNSHWGVLGIHTQNPDGSLQPSVWPEPTLLRAFVEALYLHFFLPKKMRGRWLLSGYFDYQGNQPVGMVLGAYYWIKRDCLEKIGYLDDQIFMFGEDLEFCMRARRNGFLVLYLHQPQYIHSGNQATLQKSSKWRIHRTVTSQYYVLSLYHNRLWLLVYCLFQMINFFSRWILFYPRKVFRTLLKKENTQTGGYFKSAQSSYLKEQAKIFLKLLSFPFKKWIRKEVRAI